MAELVAKTADMEAVRMEADDGVLLCFSTAPSLDVAKAIASELLERRLVACVSMVPGAVSMFRWEGEVQSENEVWLLIKTTQARCAELQTAFVELHPYEVPEWLVVTTVSALPAYVQWVFESVAPVKKNNVVES
jgi:periplasmic divalent cation tolerance protein